MQERRIFLPEEQSEYYKSSLRLGTEPSRLARANISSCLPRCWVSSSLSLPTSCTSPRQCPRMPWRPPCPASPQPPTTPQNSSRAMSDNHGPLHISRGLFLDTLTPSSWGTLQNFTLYSGACPVL